MVVCRVENYALSCSMTKPVQFPVVVEQPPPAEAVSRGRMRITMPTMMVMRVRPILLRWRCKDVVEANGFMSLLLT